MSRYMFKVSTINFIYMHMNIAFAKLLRIPTDVALAFCSHTTFSPLRLH